MVIKYIYFERYVINRNFDNLNKNKNMEKNSVKDNNYCDEEIGNNNNCVTREGNDGGRGVDRRGGGIGEV